MNDIGDIFSNLSKVTIDHKTRAELVVSAAIELYVNKGFKAVSTQEIQKYIYPKTEEKIIEYSLAWDFFRKCVLPPEYIRGVLDMNGWIITNDSKGTGKKYKYVPKSEEILSSNTPVKYLSQNFKKLDGLGYVSRNVRLIPSQIEYLEILAEKRSTSVSSILRYILSEYIELERLGKLSDTRKDSRKKGCENNE